MSHVQQIVDLYKEGKISETTIIKMAAFKAEVEKLFSEKDELKKTASIPIKILAASALAPPVFAASNYLAGRAVEYAQSGAKEIEMHTNFKNMLDYRPELKSEDQLLVKKYFDSLVHFAPAIAQDPLAAGAYVKQAMQYEDVGGPPYSTIESLVNTQKRFRESQPLKAISLGESIADKGSSISPFRL